MRPTIIHVLFLLAFLMPVSSVQGQVNISDSLALVDLYHSTNGPGWNNDSGWLAANVESWWGVRVTGDRVTGVELVGNNLSGLATVQ